MNNVISTFKSPKKICFRINTLKSSVRELDSTLANHDITVQKNELLEQAFFINEEFLKHDKISSLESQGCIYRQEFSSQLIPHFLGAKENERILDLCAAPGSKTSQIASMMNNTGKIVAVESVKDRMYRLKRVIDLLSVKNTEIILEDGRRYCPQDQLLFDRILIDAPCSSEGRFHESAPKTFQYWSLRKIKEMKRKQKGLLMNGSRFLKTGGTLIYSTCTFAPEENEAVVDWFLRRSEDDWQVEKLNFDEKQFYACLPSWNNRIFDKRIDNCLRILPNEWNGAFFIARLKKIN